MSSPAAPILINSARPCWSPAATTRAVDVPSPRSRPKSLKERFQGEQPRIPAGPLTLSARRSKHGRIMPVVGASNCRSAVTECLLKLG